MIKTAKELASACENAAKNYKTLYVLGCIGAPMNQSSKNRYTNNLSYNMKTERKNKILAATADTFGFDCVCLIKSLLWGWNGDTTKTYGGAKYASNGVPDIGTEEIIGVCNNVSTNFSKVAVGELLWMQGHVGIYIGNGLAVECTPSWKDGVQVTAVHNIGTKSGYNGRKWTKHGKLPYVTYEVETEVNSTPTTVPDEVEYCIHLNKLQRGSKGSMVEALQILLIGSTPSYSCGNYGADGDFGSATEQAVNAYKRDHGLEPNGVVDRNTWSYLLGTKE